MKLSVTKNYDALSKLAADIVVEQVAAKPASILCFPSGDTPTGMFKCLVKYARQGLVNFEQCRFVGLDEWIGLGKDDGGSCGNYLYTNFFSPLNINPSNINLFNGLAEPVTECQRMNTWLQANGPIDMMIVGVGLNGHIGLNEPGSDFEDEAHISKLSDVTVTTAQKYFSQQTKLTGGITLGLKNFSQAKKPILIASGSKKAPIIANALRGGVRPDIPASIMQQLFYGRVILDEDAASGLK
jgi:glucosamine-6-phosphate deaminase